MAKSTNKGNEEVVNNDELFVNENEIVETDETTEFVDVVEEVEQKEAKQWIVSVPFYDLIQKREVAIGEVVSHNEKREKLKLIELK